MKAPFKPFRGVAAPLPRPDINTDAIIPSAFLRSDHADLARGLFARWRFDETGAERPEFVLNRAPFRGAQILLAGPNFGCGSSREAAVWALQRYGIRCVAAPSFADIFYENALRNGLLVATVSGADLAGLVDAIESDPLNAQLDVDLERQTLRRGNALSVGFSIPVFRREALIRGDDEIALTLRHVGAIADYVGRDRARQPWLHRAIAPHDRNVP